MCINTNSNVYTICWKQTCQQQLTFYFKDGNDADLWLGVDAKSVSFYPIDDKLRANKAYQWSELADMSYSGNKFIIKLNSKMLGGGNDRL